MSDPLQHSSSSVLEFPALRELLRGYTRSPLGVARVAALVPSRDRAWFEEQQQLTAEVREFLRVGGGFEFHGLEDHGQLIARAAIAGAALESLELRDIVTVIERATEWRKIAQQPPAAMQQDWTAVARLSARIGDFSDLLRYFKNKILPDGTLDDKASPELARVRREIEKQKRAIQESLRAHLRRLTEGGAAQDGLITIRGERFVIPVKVEQKRKVQGVVHGASSSGQTVYLEPMETIEQNNELVRLIEEEHEEVHRILLEMTRRVGEQAPAVAAATDVLAELELQFAKARFANDYQCVAPIFSGTLSLDKSRHPLLERNLRGKGGNVVPLSLEMTGDERQLIISGPNTGGKTVALKTIGLLSLMAQAGIPVPAQKAELPLFDAVLADIGDYQSIEQSLSTFSAHVTNIDFISRTATRDSLVLLDELGSATDPEEGAALAVAIAEHFRAAACVSVISTHHTSLKVYAANAEGVLNASVGFDEATLQPTYELRVGVPGASAGINIAQRIGLNRGIVDAARSRLSSQTQDIARFLDKLNSDIAEIERERFELRHREQEVAREKNRLNAEGMKEQRAKLKELEKKLEQVLRDLEYRAREAVGAVQERAAATKLGKEAERRIAKLRREFKEQFDSTVVAHTTGADVGDPHAQPRLIKNIAVGDTVKLKSLGRAGMVKRRIDDNTFEIEVGIMKMKVARADVAEVLNRLDEEDSGKPRVSPVEAARARGISVSVDSDSAPSEINVIGENVDEATRLVERFVDRAFLAGLPRVRIVHGSGMGILRKALRDYLRTHPHVATVTEPQQNEGGAGATVVELRS